MPKAEPDIEALFVSELPDANPLELASKVHREWSEEAAWSRW